MMAVGTFPGRPHSLVEISLNQYHNGRSSRERMPSSYCSCWFRHVLRIFVPFLILQPWVMIRLLEPKMAHDLTKDSGGASSEQGDSDTSSSLLLVRRPSLFKGNGMEHAPASVGGRGSTATIPSPLTVTRDNDHTQNVNSPSAVATSKSLAVHRPYAYMWMIGGIHEDRHAYKGFLFDVMISVYLLKERLNSTDADFWVLAQLASDSQSPNGMLPEEDLRLLKEIGVQIRMLEKPHASKAESFASLVYEKFRALELTQYRRVIFLDADTIPLVNLDYIFHLSDPLHEASPTILRPNLIMASRHEPCNTGFFMVEPKHGRWELLASVLKAQMEKGKSLPYPHFNWYDGWGHNFWVSGDHWDAISTKEGRKWKFHAGHSDQGLMYYYTRYVVKDVSIVIGDKVENWYTNQQDEDKAELHEFYEDGLAPYFPGPPLEYEWNCQLPPNQRDQNNYFKCVPIFQGFAHFMGKVKKIYVL